MSEAIKNRYDFVVLFDCENGNPNGDPDAGNLPRVDPETQMGLVTDVCLKRKIRNYVQATKEGQPGFDIYISDQNTLNANDQKALEYLGVNDLKEIKKKDPDADRKIRDFMCQNFFDVRSFGAVMTTFVKGALNSGQVTGPVQLTFAKSVDPISPQEIAITRVAVTTEADAETKKNTMGRKSFIPYGLYRAEGFVSANLAQKVTGFSEEDLELLWEAITNMFELDHSASRGKMAVRELIVFKHNSEFGNAPAHKLFDLVKVKKNEGVEFPRSYADYTITIDEEALPVGVELQRKDV
ncbi:type I-C CRISPR-associated protein Cas7/Csd2 [Allobaculum sp. JKK-2023]|uniref:type I-C CRISPR-associated protein Cas7/Csd2 n=1 Tax=Allobaculum sp. JKK-2023 TaxID=3108943 RepID=UPI002B05EC74|nr:type I-C CRISPR-associated protein Cas7/Csd2 [Allobaculum sp. JKK-2023]